MTPRQSLRGESSQQVEQVGTDATIGEGAQAIDSGERCLLAPCIRHLAHSDRRVNRSGCDGSTALQGNVAGFARA